MQTALSAYRTEIVKLLADHGASIDLRGKDWGNILASMAHAMPETDEAIQLAKLVLNLGNNTISPPQHLAEALAIASENGGERIAKLLIS